MKKIKYIYSIFIVISLLLSLSNIVLALNYSMDSNLSNATASFHGENNSDRSGYSITCAGDINGDGHDDILIGAYANDGGGANSGQTYIFFGKGSGWVMDTDLSQADASIIGGGGDRSGISVSNRGDVNGDGLDDILIGADMDNDGGVSAGKIYLFLGNTSGWSMDMNLTNATATFTGENAGDNAGFSVDIAGDINGDGFDDILIGAEGNDAGGNYAGQVYLIFGKSTNWTLNTDLSNVDVSFIGEDASDRAGFAVAGVGDVNSDGFDDILIGAYGYAPAMSDTVGQTYLIFGNASGWSMDMDLSNANSSFIGENTADRSGYSLARVGDVNGDGFDDFIIGAYFNDENGSNAGQTYLIFGKASGWTMDIDLSNSNASFMGEVAEDNSGRRLSGAGDVNGDGFGDFLIGSQGNDEGGLNTGQIYLILGKPLGWAMDTNVSEAATSSFFGESVDDFTAFVGGGGDVNGDGYDDFLTASLVNDEGGVNTGQTYLIFPDENSNPSSITYVKAYYEDAYINEISSANVSDKIFIELQGTDGNSSRKDIAVVNVSSNISSRFGLRLRLQETDVNTGIYRGNFTIMNRSHDRYQWIKSLGGEEILISFVQDPTKNICN